MSELFRNLLRDPQSYIDGDYIAGHAFSREQIEAVHLAGLRKRFGERRDWSELLPGCWEDPQEERFGNPVYERQGVQVTQWDFERAQIRSLNLFSSGEISAEYLLAGERTPA